MPFTLGKPAPGGSGLQLAEHVGELMVFIGCTLEADTQTTYGVTNAARVEIVVPLDGEGAGEVYTDNLLFGKVIVPSLTNSESDIVVGRVAMGQAKAGQNAPYILQDPSEDEEAQVLEWLEANVVQDEQGRYSIAPDTA